MKYIGFRCILTAVLAILALSACAGPQPKPTTPTSTIIPTRSATATPIPVLVPTLLGKYELLSPEDMRYDLDELFHRLEATHPNPYAQRPKPEVDLERQRLRDELSQPMTAIEFYKKVAPLINSLGDYHTSVGLPEEVIDTLSKSERLLPFKVQIEGQHAYIVSSFSEIAIFEPGTELLVVNGTPIPVILDEVRRYLPSMDRYISPFHFWLILGSSTEYQVTFVPSGRTEPVTLLVLGLTNEEMKEQTGNSPAPEHVIYTSLPGEKIGMLTINSFMYMGLELREAFIQIQKDNIQHLIIDIRSNPGGQYAQVESTMDYLTDRSFKVCSRSYINPLYGYGSGESGETECKAKYPYKRPQRYQGKIYLLIGPDTYSAAVTFAAIFQDHGLATVIGEETLAPASYCTGVLIGIMQELPRTDLQYQYSRTCFVRPSGILDERGVIPDIVVETTIDDQIAGNDPVLNYTLEMIRNSE